ncbi:hypothetical protein IMG5_000710 [Ichthyophthirius multifiliis]|uniref:Ion transport domain-containing protein n=1 Tax=Ichthyophthirius multifiliis TaxID=5932 RepID=G0QIV8_ICHMU|nr:hypothetical protein IMG5_000710 [Ichthyophthirius multifiliis]EGR34843.1 hypothetical protein IMG5_000710 [Ichthyophthirius multifiliis]|eukprot:XP_004040147.1 hypothetical protein IMG5_000710 [Ichthyophthirius multifiliis]
MSQILKNSQQYIQSQNVQFQKNIPLNQFLKQFSNNFNQNNQKGFLLSLLENYNIFKKRNIKKKKSIEIRQRRQGISIPNYTETQQQEIIQQIKSQQQNQQTKVEKNIIILMDLVSKLSQDKLIEKSQRHFKDALLYRSVRNDLDNANNFYQKFTLFIYKIQNSSIWNDLLLFMSWVYIILSFFQPVNRIDKSLNKELFTILYSIETFIISLQLIDFSMEIFQRLSQLNQNKNIINLIFSKQKTLFRSIFFFLLFSDYLQYSFSYPINTLRFARIIRPLQIIVYSKPLRRNFQGIIKSAKNLLIIFIFYFIFIAFWAYVGYNTIGEIDQYVDKYSIDYQNIWKTVNILYVVSTFDQLPDILIPLVIQSKFYLLYYIPYILIFLLLFLPIPTAVVYDGFRQHRLNLFICIQKIYKKKYIFCLIIADRIKRRIALLACFQCLVNNNMQELYIEQEQFIKFFTKIYQEVEEYEEAKIISIKLWNYINQERQNKINIDQFFNVIDIIEQQKEFSLSKIKPFKQWIKFRNYILKKFNLQIYVENLYFEIFIFIITLISCSLAIISIFTQKQQTLIVFDIIDNIILVIFIIEIIFKIIIYGIYKYMDNGWNRLHIILSIIQIINVITIYAALDFDFFKQFAAITLVKITKIQRVFRILKTFRTIKIIQFLFAGLDIIEKVHQMFYKIVICIPIVLKLSVIIFILFYIYASLGVEIFTTLPPVKFRQFGKYGFSMCNPYYADFNNFLGANLILLQICIAATWSNVVFDYAYKFDNMIQSIIFFNSFYFIAIFILSLIGGIIWEVFNVVERISNYLQIIEEQQEILENLEKQQLLLENINFETDYNKYIDVVYNIAQLEKRNYNFLKQETIIIKANGKIQNLDRNDDEEDDIEDFEKSDQEVLIRKSSDKIIIIQDTTNSQILNSNQSETPKVKIQIKIKLISNILFKNKQNNLKSLQRIKEQQIKKLNKKKLFEYFQKNLQKLENKNKQMFQKKINLDNTNTILNLSILQSADLQKIKNMEYRYFKKVYGQKFNQMTDANLKILWNQQSKILFHFDNICKYDYVPMTQFIQVFLTLEMQISALIMNKFTSFKFIFYDDVQNKWFTINFLNDQFCLQNIYEGPWDFYEELFQNKNEIIKHKNIYNYNQNNKYISQYINLFFRNSQRLSNNYFFNQLTPGKNPCDIIYIPFQNDNPQKVHEENIQILKNITKVDQFDYDLQNLICLKKGLIILHVFPTENHTQQINQQKEFLNFNMNQAFLEDKIFKQQQDNATLDQSGTYEFIKDLKNHIENYKNQIFKKISQFHLYCYSLQKSQYIKSMQI